MEVPAQSDANVARSNFPTPAIILTESRDSFYNVACDILFLAQSS